MIEKEPDQGSQTMKTTPGT